MDKFNYRRFFREIESPKPFKGLDYVLKALERESFNFTEFWGVAQGKVKSYRFLTLYFKGNKVSHKLLNFFVHNDTAALKEVIKDLKVFLSEKHYPLVKASFDSDEAFILELNFWRNIFQEMQREIDEEDKILSELNFEELLLYCGFYYEKLRIAHGIERNTDRDLIGVIDSILNFKFKKIKANGKLYEGRYTAKSFRDKGSAILDTLILNGDASIANVFRCFEKQAKLNYLYDKYCFLDFSISFFNSQTANLKPIKEDSYLKYRNDGKKYLYWQNYSFNTVMFETPEIIEEIESSEASWYNKTGAKRTLCNMLQYLDTGLPDPIEMDSESKLNAHDFFKIINSIAGWSNIRWNNFIEEHIIAKGNSNPYEIMKAIISHNEAAFNNDAMPVLFREFQSLLEMAEEINGTESNSGRHSLLLFTNNISHEETYQVNISNKPFIKVGRNIYWIAGILSNKNYAIMLQNVLLKGDKKKSEGSPVTMHSKNVESKIEELFSKNNFKTIRGHEFIAGKGEIDLLALKGNTLFVAEIKSTFIRESLREIHAHFTNEQTGIKKAVSQLQKDIRYLRENWNHLKPLLETSLSFDEVRIVPLAVSSTLEDGEQQLAIEGYKGYIVSVIDLTVILANKKFYLLNVFDLALKSKFMDAIPLNYMLAMQGIDSNMSVLHEINDIVEAFLKENVGKLNINLWKEGNMLCSPEDIIAALDKGSVWDFIEKDNNLYMKSLIIGNYTLNYFE